MSDTRKLKILSIGLEKMAADRISAHLPGAELRVIGSVEEFEQILNDMTDETADLIVCGPSFDGLPISEVAQVFRNQAPHAKMYYVPLQRKAIDFKGLIKNGFDEVYVMPADDGLMAQALRAVERDRTGHSQVVYKSVSVKELEPNTKVDFSISIYLPMNKKHVKVVKEGGSIQENQLQKFKDHNVTSLEVEERDLSKFLQYSETHLKKTKSQENLNLAQWEKFRLDVRELFQSLISEGAGDFQQGKTLMQSCQKIISDYVPLKSNMCMNDKMASLQDQNDDSVYGHCGRVATIAAILSHELKIGKPEDLAIAGLFHDLGKVTLPPDLLTKRYSKMSPDERKVYNVFPEESLRILQEKKLVLNDKIRDIILQQCERPDGSGFPSNLPAHKIDPAAQVLCLANELDERLQVRSGKKRLQTIEVLNEIENARAVALDIILAAKKLFNQTSNGKAS